MYIIITKTKKNISFNIYKLKILSCQRSKEISAEIGLKTHMAARFTMHNFV